MKKTIVIIWKTVKLLFIVFCFYVASLFYREQRLDGVWLERCFEHFAPGKLVLGVDSFAFGFRHGVSFRGVHLYDSSARDSTQAIASADLIRFFPLSRKLRIVGAKYPRLPDSYYAPENVEKNAPVEVALPELGEFELELINPDILAVNPRKVTAEVGISSRRVDFKNVHLVWPDQVRPNLTIDGSGYVDFDEQVVYGKIGGLAHPSHIRPMLVAIDVPVALPYMDAFTDLPGPCPAGCEWRVDLVRNDLDLWLDLRPELGRYRGVPMKRAQGRIHLHNYTRGNCLNYRTTVGPVVADSRDGRKLDGTIVITGTNNYNTVDIEANSTQQLADVLRIAGFEGDYVSEEVTGESECSLQFRFPRSMTNNYEVLDGHGKISVNNGHLMRMNGFKGLIEAMPSVAPAITWFSDSTKASCEYVIENGVLRSDNIYIEGSMFSIKMYGSFDAVANELDFTVRVQFAQKDSWLGKIIHPLSWPFTKLLLEFRLTGTPENPKWTYISVVKRILEVVE